MIENKMKLIFIFQVFFGMAFGCFLISENHVISKFAFSNVPPKIQKLVKSAMTDVERFSNKVLRFEEDLTSPCLMISLMNLKHSTFGEVILHNEVIHMNLNETFFLSNSKTKAKKKVVFHELGHVVGLKHTDNPIDLMHHVENDKQQIDSFVQAIKRRFSKKNRNNNLKINTIERTVNATFIPTSFGDCIQVDGSAIVTFSFSKDFYDLKNANTIRKVIDVSHKFLEIISPLRFQEVDVSISRSCIEYSIDDHPNCDSSELFSFPSMHVPQMFENDLMFMIDVINYFKKPNKLVIFNPKIKSTPNIERDCVDFQEFHVDSVKYSPIVFYFFTFFTKVLGFVPRYDGFHHFLDPTSMFVDEMFINNCFGDFSLLIKVIDVYMKNAS